MYHFCWVATQGRIILSNVKTLMGYVCESWTLKKAERQWIDAFELWCWRRLFRVPWIARRSNQSILPKVNQFWIFIRRTDAEAETLILWQPDAKSQLIRKDPDAGKDWRNEEKGVTEDEMVGWHHWLNGHELSKLWGMAKDREARHPAVHGLQRVGYDSVTEQQFLKPP